MNFSKRKNYFAYSIDTNYYFMKIVSEGFSFNEWELDVNVLYIVKRKIEKNQTAELEKNGERAREKVSKVARID